MNVGQLMTRSVRICEPQDALNTAAQLMWDNNCGTVAVVADGKAVGMLTDRDICMAAYTQGRPLSQIPVSTAMSKQLFACHPEDSVMAAEKILRANKIARLPVVSGDGHLRGILSLDDIAREALRERHGKGPVEVTAEEVCETLGAICERSAPPSGLSA